MADIGEILEALAAHLAGRREAVLAAWQQRVDADPQMTTASAMPRSQFRDHIPDVLDDLAARLRGDARETRDKAALHGSHRWQQGFHLREVTREWGHLHLALLDEVERYPSVVSDVPAEAMVIARRVLTEVVGDGLCESTSRYFAIQQTEAEGQVRDLERALAEGQGDAQRQGEAWREAAHDLRGSLGVVQMVATLLARADVPEARRTEMVATLKRGVESLQHLLEDVLGLARLQAGHEQRQVQAFDAGELLAELSAAARPLAEERGLTLRTSGPASLVVRGDAPKVRRIAQNLLLNALKYTRAGSVTLTWGDSRPDDPARWMLSVQDTGPGLQAGPAAAVASALAAATAETSSPAPPAAVPPAESSAPAATPAPLPPAPGEGIGLAIVKRLCELLDATLELHTEAGRGTVVAVILPRAYPGA